MDWPESENPTRKPEERSQDGSKACALHVSPSFPAAPAGQDAAVPIAKHVPRAPQGAARPGDISGRRREGGAGIGGHNQGLVNILIAARLPQHLGLDTRARVHSGRETALGRGAVQ